MIFESYTPYVLRPVVCLGHHERYAMFILRVTGLALLLAAGLAIVATDVAEARIGGGKSFGSRGSRTYNAPPSTNTAPNAAPVDRSMAPRTNPTAAQSPMGAQPSRFGGWGGILMGGLFVAALGGIFGFGALASGLGFLLQFALIAGLIYLAFAFFRNRRQPALAGMPGGGARNPAANSFNRQSFGMGGGNSGSSPLQIGQPDLDAFERLLGEIQTAYSQENTRELETRTTPEMLSYFLQELADQAKQGVRNEVTGVKLLQGDIAEAWSEQGSDYATVAIRYALIDVTRDRTTGRIVSGDAERPTEATELWTFRRDERTRADGWQLSAIQQTA
jgi:predicted lipid-binding transport protein (Tim44 family)